MAFRTVSTLKFVGSISLGLLTGLSYSLSTLTLPTLVTLPSASSASRAFTSLRNSSVVQTRALAAISGTSFVLAYIFSPRSQKHPYLLWSTVFVGSAGIADFLLPASKAKAVAASAKKQRDRKGKGRHMDASYEVLGASDRESESTMSGEEMDEDVNGEELRQQMDGFVTSSILKTAIAGIGFAMSVVGIWGEGAADLDIIDL